MIGADLTEIAEGLPPVDQWPDLSAIEELGYPPALNVVAELLDRHLPEHAGRVAIISDSTTHTYGELAQAVGKRANLMRGSGLKPGDTILLRSPNNVELVSWWLAVLRIGAVAVTTAPLLRAKELDEICQVARPRLAIVDSRLASDWRSADPAMETWWIGPDAPDDVAAMLAMQQDDCPLEQTAADDIAILAFTSGSTGGAKATIHFHRDLLAIADTYAADVLRPSPADVFIGSPPLAFTFGLGALVIFPLRFGATSMLLEAPGPDALVDAIAEHGATLLFTAPTAYRYLCSRVDRQDVRTLRACVSAGEALPPQTFEMWKSATGIEILDGIGSTEMLHIFISSRPGSTLPGEVGVPVRTYEARIVDEEGVPLPPGTTGRLAVRGPTGCRYLNDARQAQYVQQGWNITGDLFEMTDRGTFVYRGRSDDMIITSGYNVSAIDVEQALMLHPAVKEVAVIGRPDADRGHIVSAYIVLTEGFTGSETLAVELQDHVKQVIAPFKYPRRIEFVSSLPKTPTGKLQRHRLKADAGRGV